LVCKGTMFVNKLLYCVTYVLFHTDCEYPFEIAEKAEARHNK
jgi:hypothetical protein